MSRRALCLALSLALGLAGAGCGRRGEPVPSRLRLPGPPTDVSLSAPGGRLVLSWSPPRQDLAGRPVRAVGGYVVLRGAWPPGTSGCWTCPGAEEVAATLDAVTRRARGLPVTAWEDPDVRPGWMYRYRVRALDPRGRPGPLSAAADITWQLLPPPHAEAFPGDGSARIRVRPGPWPEGVRPLALRVYDPGGEVLAEAPPGADAVTVEGLTNGREHRLEVRVAGRTPEGWEVESPGTPVVVVPADTTPPAPPTLAVFQEPGGVRLAWVPEGSEPYARVRILRAEGSGPLRQIARVPGDRSGYLDASVRAGREYRYTLVAVDAAGNESLPAREVRVRWRAPGR